MHIVRPVFLLMVMALYSLACSNTEIQNQPGTDGDLDSDTVTELEESAGDGDLEVDSVEDVDDIDVKDIEGDAEVDGDGVEDVEQDIIDGDVDGDREDDGVETEAVEDDVEITDTEVTESDVVDGDDDTVDIIDEEIVDGDVIDDEVIEDDTEIVDGDDDTVENDTEIVDGDVEIDADNDVVCTCSTTDACCDGCNPINQGGECNDGNLCTLEDYCSDGVCISGNERPCFAQDQCQDAACNPNTGACETFDKDDGTACNDNDLCTQSDTCLSGVCTGADPVMCQASDQCKQAACNSATGQCEESGVADNTPCDDADMCTRVDVCMRGVCQGGDPVECTALDQCHQAGVCDSQTGQCSNPQVPDSTPCDDGNAQTGADECIAGVCTGIPCDCSFANECCDGCFIVNEGGMCSDGNLCTLEDYCSAGACVPGNERPCFATDQCQDAACNPNTGACENFNKDDGIACNDGNLCTRSDACASGVCVGSDPVECLPSDQCKQAACNSATGQCEERNLNDNTPCNDLDLCTQVDVCISGTCEGTDPVECTALDQCHLEGVCDSQTGQCSNPVAQDDTICDDGNPATGNDRCVGGVCLGDNCECSGVNNCCDGCFIQNNGAACEDEGLYCTSDTCVEGVCEHSLDAGYCLIGNTCYMDSDDNPENYCQYCDTVFSTEQWRNKQNGIECDDGNLCSTRDRCSGGVCAGNDWISCDPPQMCYQEGVCQPDTGQCTYEPQANGTACDDGNLCTQTDECSFGTCVGMDDVVCVPVAECYGAGYCDETTGVCSEPVLPNLTPCNYNETGDDTGRCFSGVCEELVVPDNNTCDGAEEISGDPGIYYIDVDTRSADNNYEASCGNNARGLEVVYTFTLTADTHYIIQTDGNFDSVLYLRDEPCETGTELICNDDAFAYPNYGSLIEGDLPAGTYYLFVDGYGYTTPKPGTSVLTVEFSVSVVDGDVDVDEELDAEIEIETEIETDIEDACAALPCLPGLGEGTWSANDTPVPTVDNTTVSSVIDIPDFGSGAAALTATVHVQHGYYTALTVVVRAPCGREMVIHDQTNVQVNGDYVLTDMVEVPLGGTWELLVTDNDAFGDTGEIVSWSLTNSCTAVVDGDVDIDTDVVDTEETPISPVTVYDIQNNTSPLHPAVNSAVVTVPVVAISPLVNFGTTVNGFFVADTTDYGPWKGIQVVTDVALAVPNVRAGDLLVLEGTYVEYQGLSEINATSVSVVGTAPVPDPIYVADPSIFATDPDFAESYESVFIEIRNVTVLANDLGYDEFSVTGDFRVDDRLYDYPTVPAVGTSYSILRGPVGYSYGAYKIWPRSAEDMVQGP